jgi:hypothetical protein
MNESSKPTVNKMKEDSKIFMTNTSKMDGVTDDRAWYKMARARVMKEIMAA